MVVEQGRSCRGRPAALACFVCWEHGDVEASRVFSNRNCAAGSSEPGSRVSPPASAGLWALQGVTACGEAGPGAGLWHAWPLAPLTLSPLHPLSPQSN